MKKFGSWTMGARLAPAVAAAALWGAAAAMAGTVVATPGSLAGYTYFPPSATSSGGGSSAGTDNVGTLQRCFWAPTVGDYTLNLSTSNWYDYGDDRPLTVYYKIVGGDGGQGPAGGGGGSSAILKNGTLVALGPGGSGSPTLYGNKASTADGSFKVVKADTLRFVTGGGGGDSAFFTYTSTYYGITGGGGGAGYTSGGGGASSDNSVSMTDTEKMAGLGGKGGDASPGAGGFATMLASNIPGTAGIGMNGGVATRPDGSSAPIGTIGAVSYFSCSSGYSCSGTYRHAATPTKNGSNSYLAFGSIGGGVGATFAGGGGSLGQSGAAAATLYSDAYQSGSVSFTISNNQPNSYGNAYGGRNTYGTHISLFSQPATLDFTRKMPDPAYMAYSGGGLPGQIVLMYQAPVCSILK